MIKNKEIYAEYFKSSNSISFNQLANIDEIDDWMKKYEEWDNKMYSRAIVDSITALEIAINNKLKKINIDGIFQGQINKFNNQLNLDARIFVIFYDLVPKETILDAIDCKDLRNQIVHNGVRAHESDKKKFLSIISCMKALYQEITLKFPSIEAKQIIKN